MRVSNLAEPWIFGALPLWFVVALVWILFGCADVCRGIFRMLGTSGNPDPPRWRLLGAGGILAGMAMAIAPAVAFNQVQSRHNCSEGCSIFDLHRHEVAWLSFRYIAMVAVVVGLVAFISARRSWRWMG